MTIRAALMTPALTIALSVLVLTGCATSVAATAGSAGSPSATGPAETPSAAASPDQQVREAVTDAEARARAQAWLDAAALPPGAMPADAGTASFSSYTGWPCGPYEQLQAFWTIPDTSVADAANWLREHPTADLVTTSVAPVSDDPTFSSAIVGFVPAHDAQEGIVYTVEKSGDGVAIRAEIAAQTASATCPVLPDGGTWGPPGQG